MPETDAWQGAVPLPTASRHRTGYSDQLGASGLCDLGFLQTLLSLLPLVA